MSNKVALVPFGPAARPPDPLLTVRQLALREGLADRTIRMLIEKHGLPCYRAGGVKIRLSEYLAWLAERRQR